MWQRVLKGIVILIFFVILAVTAREVDARKWVGDAGWYYSIDRVCRDGLLLTAGYPTEYGAAHETAVRFGARLHTTASTSNPNDGPTSAGEAFGALLAAAKTFTITYHTTPLPVDLNSDGTFEGTFTYYTQGALLWSRHLDVGPGAPPVVITYVNMGRISQNVEDCYLNRLTVRRGGAATIGKNQLEVNYGRLNPGDTVYRLGAPPAHGELRLNGVVLNTGSTFTQDDVNDNRLTYTHDESLTKSDSFTFTVRSTTRVSVASNGAEALNGSSYQPSLSPGGSFTESGGRYITFVSTATNLVSADTNICPGYPTSGTCPDIFTHDMATGETIRASVSSSGTQSNDASFAPAMSNYSKVVFESLASNWTTGDECLVFFGADGGRDIFRHVGETSRVSVTPVRWGKCYQANADSYAPSVSEDGSSVVFESDATNLLLSVDTNEIIRGIWDTNSSRDIFINDGFDTHFVSNVTGYSGYAGGAAQANGNSYNPSISAYGDHVAFESDATNLIGSGSDANNRRDIFVRESDKTARVSVNTNPFFVAEANGDSYDPSISSSGRYVAFRSDATNLVLGDTLGFSDIFVHDRDLDGDGNYDEFCSIFPFFQCYTSTTRLSVASDGSEADNHSYAPSFSAYGRYVAFSSYATNLVNGDANLQSDIFVRDRQTGQTARVSIAATGAQANGGSFRPAILADGEFIAFESDAAKLVPGDTNNNRDVFIHYVGFTSGFPIAICCDFYLPVVLRNGP
jgi:hypothetical protein